MWWKMKLTKKEVHHLYYDEEKSLAEIGKLGGVTKQRISQLMGEWKYPRRASGWRKHNLKFTDLNLYFEHSKKTGKQSHEVFLRLIKPLMQNCENCGSETKLHIRCFKRPITSFSDFKILCPVCLYAPSRKGIDGLKRKEICRSYSEGSVPNLAKKYGVSPGMIYYILKKNLTKLDPMIKIEFDKKIESAIVK